MNLQNPKLVDKIHKTPTKVVLFVTGGGLEIFQTLTHRGGGSATLLSGLIPYDTQETIELLGGVPEKLVSEKTTREMAMVAFQRALKLSKGEYPVIGVAASAVLQKTPYEREGRKHFVYAALQTDTKTVSCVLDLHDGIAEPKDTGPIPPDHGVGLRIMEEMITANLILNLIAEGCGLEERITLGYGVEDDLTRRESTLTGISINKIMSGHPVSFDLGKDTKKIETATFSSTSYRNIFPGRFNPIHADHWEMCALACEQFGFVEFEISIGNVEKPTLDLISLEETLKQFCQERTPPLPVYFRVWVTNAPTFVQKADMFPGATFIVGYDTAKRICDPKYAGNIEEVMEVFKKNDVDFLVFGRELNGVYKADVSEFPTSFRQIVVTNTEPRQYSNISSSEIRRRTSEGHE
jgi:nicotinic acid mononucleotide adenylyltransferase